MLVLARVKPGSQYDAGASVASRRERRERRERQFVNYPVSVSVGERWLTLE